MRVQSALLMGVLMGSLPVFAAQPAPVVPAQPAAAVTGVWVTPNNKSRVRIYQDAEGKFYGKIIWLKQPDYPANYKVKSLAGKPKVDRHNPNKRLRGRAVLGLDILTGFRYLPKQHAWGKGKCYDPTKGKTYNCRMWFTGNGKDLKLRGYIWIFYRTETWVRYQAPENQAAPAAPSPRTAATVY